MPRLIDKPEIQKGVSIGAAYGWGAALGGLVRVSTKAAAAVEFLGAVGGLIGAMVLPRGWADASEGIAAGSGALLAMALTAPTAVPVVPGKAAAKGKVDRLMIKEGAAAKEIIFGAEVKAAVGAGLAE